ncbi:MAG: phosphatase PAP2 family protein [Solirubrobacterales bacterium]
MAWLLRPPQRRSRDRVTRPLVRAGAVAALGCAIAAPLVRKRLRLPASATTAALAAGPLALAVLKPRTKKRDAALFALQMWAFVHAHELPYDDPRALQRRLRIDYPIRLDRRIGLGELPNVRLQRALGGRSAIVDQTLTWAHWLWFLEPHAAMVWILANHNDRFPRAARQLAAVYDLGCLTYFAVPTAPPWWASEQGHTGAEIERKMVEVGERTWRGAWPRMYDSLGGNPWAAMPSLHFATSVMVAIHLSEAGTLEGVAGWSYALTLGFALVYLGEHYVTDLIAGAALVFAVRRGEPYAEPVVLDVNRGLQRLERIASGSG